MTKRFGFTLAEVLITLGIIGVVAAMTIPTLVSNTNGAQFKTAYKKALSTLNQGILMNVAMDDTDFSSVAKADATSGTTIASILGERMNASEITNYPTDVSLKLGSGDDAKTNELTYTFACGATGSANAGKHADGTALATGESCEGTVGTGTVTMDSAIANYKKYAFADGTAFLFHKDATNCSKENVTTNKCYGYIDVNGANNPNTVISDADSVQDLFPVIFYGQTVEPASDAARSVLFGK
ncbi:prepilin-type N-terminal cleavage/methylation domain-containing protein [bacterium]|nr:prepilin-type N-terminal cleavage/methylation domain-containing protein [bacterium]